MGASEVAVPGRNTRSRFQTWIKYSLGIGPDYALGQHHKQVCNSASTGEDDDAGDNSDRLVLKPAELADLIFKERMTTGLNKAMCKQCKRVDSVTTTNIIALLIPSTIQESRDDAEVLKNRKIWSRWGKWSGCSVSCGEGYVTRQRACVSGLCARGEREEQRRPCHGAPCMQADEPHESE